MAGGRGKAEAKKLRFWTINGPRLLTRLWRWKPRDVAPRDLIARRTRCLKSIHDNSSATGMALTHHSVGTTVKAAEKEMAKGTALNNVCWYIP